MLGINRKNILHDKDLKPEPTAWEPCSPNPTAVIYFWIKRVGSFGLKKTTLPNEYFFCILPMRRKMKEAGFWEAINRVISGVLQKLGYLRFSAKKIENFSDFQDNSKWQG